MSPSTSEIPETIPRETLRGHTDWVRGVVHLPVGQRIVTCSVDGSLRLWNQESGTQIGDDWQEDNGVWSMALSPSGQTVANGHDDGKVKLWNVETRKVIAKWEGHSRVVGALCWSADGSQVGEWILG
jgi:WD40 repeat protein